MNTPKSRLLAHREKVCQEIGIPLLSPRAVNVLLRLGLGSKEEIRKAINHGRLEGAMNVGITTLNEIRECVGMVALPTLSLQARIKEAWKEAASLLLEVKDIHPKKKKLKAFLKKSEELDVFLQDSNKK